MALSEVARPEAPPPTDRPAPAVAPPARDLQRAGQLVLATLWLLDAVLQLQPMMFTAGPDGLSGMLAGAAAGNPVWVADTIRWNAALVAHHPVAADTAFASVQFAIAFGILGRRTLRAALALSVVWAVAVWWFGEGLGGLAAGTATPLGGGPGGALFYAVAAVLLWPSERSDAPFVAARAVGERAARRVWAGLWATLAVLAVTGAGRTPRLLRRLVTGVQPGQPGWLLHLDGLSAPFLAHHGAAAAAAFAGACVAAGAAGYASGALRKAALVGTVVGWGVIWVAVQDLGGILTGGGSDPSSGLPIVLLALLYWPVPATPGAPPARGAPAGGCRA